MAITKSAKKAHRQSIRRNEGNQEYKKNLKEALKKVRVLATEKKVKELQAILPEVYKALDKAAKVGIIKKNNASRRKSRLTLMAARVGK